MLLCGLDSTLPASSPETRCPLSIMGTNRAAGQEIVIYSGSMMMDAIETTLPLDHGCIIESIVRSKHDARLDLTISLHLARAHHLAQVDLYPLGARPP